MPKYKGFNRKFKKEVSAVNLETLEKYFNEGDIVNIANLKEKGIVKKNSEEVKILGKGELNKKLTIENMAISKSAAEKIMKVGGTIK